MSMKVLESGPANKGQSPCWDLRLHNAWIQAGEKRRLKEPTVNLWNLVQVGLCGLAAFAKELCLLVEKIGNFRFVVTLSHPVFY